MKTCSKPKLVQKYQNTTKVPDWRDPSDPLYSPAGIAPFPIYNTAGCPTCDDGTNWDPSGELCGTVDPVTHLPNSAPCTGSPPLPVVNTTVAVMVDGKPVMVEVGGQSSCGLWGWKGVATRSLWNGIYSFVSGSDKNVYVGCSDCTGFSYHKERLTSPDTKYLSVSKNYSVSGSWNPDYYGPGWPPAFSYGKSESYTLNAQSGVCVQGSSSSDFYSDWNNSAEQGGSGPVNYVPGADGYPYGIPIAAILDGGIGNNLDSYIGFFCGFKTPDWQLGVAGGEFSIGSCSSSGGILIHALSGLPIETWTWDGTHGERIGYYVHPVDPMATPLVWTSDVAYLATGTLTETHADISLTTTNWSCYDDIQVSQFSSSFSADISNTNTWDSIQADEESLAATWPLNDDTLYPWRVDGDFTTMPMVSRNQIQGTIAGAVAWLYPGWVDENSGSASSDFTSYEDGSDYDFTAAISGMDTNRSHYTFAIVSGDLAPGLSFDAATGRVTGTSTQNDLFSYRHECVIVATNTVHPGPFYDGSIVGAPLMIGGAIAYGLDNWWDATQEIMLEACVPATVFIEQYGKWRSSSSLGLPGACTQWTHELEAKYAMPPGAFAGSPFTLFDRGDGTPIFAARPPMLVKFAVQRPPIPAQSFFGAAAMRRFDFDEAHVRCIESAVLHGDGTATLTLDDGSRPESGHGADSPPTWAAGLYIVSDQGGGLDGVWNVAAQGASWTVTLTSLKWTLPAGYTRKPNGSLLDFTGAFGPLKWPSAWCIGGRVPVVGATQSGGSVILEIVARALSGDARALRTADTVDLSGVPGLGANLAVTKIDDTHFSVPGTLSGVYANGGWMTAHGAPDWKFWDARSNGNFLLMEWYQDWRDFAERDANINLYAGCEAFTGVTCDCGPLVPGGATIRPNQLANGMPRPVYNFTVAAGKIPAAISPCGGGVICISPNGESFPNGVTYGFPSSADTLPDIGGYVGRLWQAAPLLTQVNTAMSSANANLVPSNATYGIHGNYNLFGLTPGFTYQWIKGANDSTCAGLSSSGSFVASASEVVLTGTASGFVTGKVIAGNITPDYGELWSQNLSLPCENAGSKNEPLPISDGQWEGDNGTCADDDEGSVPPVYYHAENKMVEPLLAVPAGGAALPPGVYLNYLTIADLNDSSPPNGLATPPPVSGFEGRAYPAPLNLGWPQWQNATGCAGTTGRFAAIYADFYVNYYPN